MEKKCGEGNERQVYEFAICFSRMWGIAETLEELPNVGFERIRDIVMQWAEEYVAGEEQDFIKFFLYRINEKFSLTLPEIFRK